MVRRSPPVMLREPSKGSRCVSVLRQRFPFAAVRASHEFFPADPHTPRKVEVNDLGHVVVLKSLSGLEASPT